MYLQISYQLRYLYAFSCNSELVVHGFHDRFLKPVVKTSLQILIIEGSKKWF